MPYEGAHCIIFIFAEYAFSYKPVFIFLKIIREFYRDLSLVSETYEDEYMRLFVEYEVFYRRTVSFSNVPTMCSPGPAV